MQGFSRDVDILRYEASLFGDLHFPWQILCQGQGGQISGTTFTTAGEDFVSAGVSGGGVIYLRSSDGIVDGVYEIVSVDSATTLTISVVRSDDEASAVGPGDASLIDYRISTFDPQSSEVALQLTQYFGIRPGDPDSAFRVEDILDAGVLRQVSVYAVIAGIYATLVSSFDGEDDYWKKSLHYRKLFEKARERCRLSFDPGGDGIGDRTNTGGSVRLVRD